jgi:hypothetical protein
MKNCNSRLVSSFWLTCFIYCLLPSVHATFKTSLLPKDLPSDILKLIASNNKPVRNISVDEVSNELQRREFSPSESDLRPINIESLPLDILTLISNSPTSIAGILPKDASEEIFRRVETVSTDDVAESSLEVISDGSGEQEAINNWADNEDKEEMEKFVRKSEEGNDVEDPNIPEGDDNQVERKLKQFADSAP